MLISFEGIDGSGKTSVLKALGQELQARGHKVLLSREPGGSLLGQNLRRILLDGSFSPAPMAELFLFLADRAEHVANVLRPALGQRQIVLCDRYTDSTLVYQGYVQGVPLEHLQLLNDLATNGLSPEITILLDLPVKLAASRLQKRAEQNVGSLGRIDGYAQSFHEKVRQGYLELAKLHPERIVLVEAEPPLAWVLKTVKAKLRARGLEI